MNNKLKETLLENGFVDFDADGQLLEDIKELSKNLNSFKINRLIFNSNTEFIPGEKFSQFGSFEELTFIKHKILEYFKDQKNFKDIEISSHNQLRYTYESSYNDFKNILKPIYDFFYKNETFDLELEDLFVNATLNLYDSGCYLNPHKDFADKSALCTILIYLNENWNSEEQGGLLELEDGYKVEPILGKIAILDYTNHSITHGVDVVKYGDRYAITCFIRKWDLDSQTEEDFLSKILKN